MEKKIRIAAVLSLSLFLLAAGGTAFANETKSPPMLLPCDSWYKFNVFKSNIQYVEFVDSYIPDGTEAETAFADVDEKGDIRVYLLSGRKKVIIAGNGSGKILANENSSKMFHKFEALLTISGLELLDTANAVSMDSMFQDCIRTQCFNVSAFDTSSVISMCSMFKNCSCMEELDISTWDMSNVKDTSWMFFNCASLHSIRVPQMQKASLENTAYMFAECYELHDPDLHGLNTSGVTNMTAMFRHCVSLEEPDLTFLETGKLATGYLMFEGCTNLIALDMFPMDVGCIAESTGADFFGDSVYPHLLSFRSPVNVCVDAPMPDPGSCYFYLSGNALTYIPRSGINGADLRVECVLSFLDDDETVIETRRGERGFTTATPSEPVRQPSDEGTYSFDGWYLEDELYDFTCPVTEDRMIEAHWNFTPKEPEPGDPPGGSGGSGSGSGGNGNTTGNGSGSGGTTFSGSGSSSGSGGSSGGTAFSGGGRSPSGVQITVAGTSTFSSYWYTDTSGVWRIKDKKGKPITSAWLCDDAVEANGKNVWYLIGSDGSMLANGLVQDRTGNFYSLETTHNGYYGMLRYKNGFYKCGAETLYITFNHEHNGSFGAITSADALAALKRIYGVTIFPIGNENIIYTGSF